ncbi:MAG: carbon monoxide dehydrogenase subunit G [Salinirussus sp.]|jgi:carbon monoxide dehydrogenase subunit G
MVTVQDSVRIDAPRGEVFEYVSDPTHQVEITPAITDISVLKRLPNGGHRSEFVYDMVGVDLTGESEQVVFEPPERLVCDLTGTIDAQLTWEFAAVDSGDRTRVTYTAEYDLPSAVLERAVRPIVERYNERILSTTLNTLKRRVEAMADATA